MTTLFKNKNENINRNKPTLKLVCFRQPYRVKPFFYFSSLGWIHKHSSPKIIFKHIFLQFFLSVYVIENWKGLVDNRYFSAGPLAPISSACSELIIEVLLCSSRMAYTRNNFSGLPLWNRSTSTTLPQETPPFSVSQMAVNLGVTSLVWFRLCSLCNIRVKEGGVPLKHVGLALR